MKKISLLILLCCATLASAQNSTNRVTLPEVVPPSPQAQIFTRYINHEVSGSNGLPDIQIPFYEINFSGLRIPVGLNYHASGIQYKQYDGDTGAGWSILAAGYRVSRTIYGKPDEKFGLYSMTDLQNVLWDENRRLRDAYLSNLLFSSGKCHELSYGTNFTPQDGEYDQFTYMLPSSGGNFIISDRNLRTVASTQADQARIVVDEGLSGGLQLKRMKIVDNAGFTYYMGETQTGGTELVETSWNRDSGNVNTSWLLNRIVSPHGEQITFTYTFYERVAMRWQPLTITVTDAPTAFLNEMLYDTTVRSGEAQSGTHGVTRMAFISRIETPHEIVEFTRSTSTNRYIPPVIQEVSIKDKTSASIIRRMRLSYATSPAEANTSDVTSAWHTLLQSVEICGSVTGSSSERYRFDYYNAPQEYSYPDQWGYYQSNSSFTNKNGVLHEEFADNQFQMTKSGVHYTNSRISSVLGNIGISGLFRNRSSNSTVPNYFSLKKITFPTGGSTEYEYECNKFSLYNRTIQGAGLRIRKITSDAGDGSDPVISVHSYGENDNGLGVMQVSWGPDYRFCFANEVLLLQESVESARIKGLDRITVIRTYGSKPLIPETDSFLKVSYLKHTVRNYTGTTGMYSGKTVYSYSMPQEYTISDLYMDLYFPFTFSAPLYDYGNHALSYYNLGRKTNLTNKRVFNDNEILLVDETTTYTDVATPSFTGVRVLEKVLMEQYYVSYWSGTSNNPYNYVNSLFGYGYNYTRLYSSLPATKTIVMYDKHGTTPVTEVVNYQYDNRYRVNNSTKTLSNGTTRTEQLIYPASGTALNTCNIVGSPVETITTADGAETFRLRRNFATSSINPSSVQTSSSGTANLYTDVRYTRYDSYGNLLEYITPDGVTTAIIWAYNHKYPVAEIKNATYTQVESVMGGAGSLNNLSNRSEPTAAEWTSIVNLRRNLPGGALVTICRYKPLIGLIQMTAPSGLNTYYDYDSLGRLSESYYYENEDTGKKRVLETYKYNYKN